MASAGSSSSLPPDPDQNSGLVYSTFLGGSGEDRGRGIALDAGGAATVVGTTRSTEYGHGMPCPYPTTPGAFDPGYNGYWDAFMTRPRLEVWLLYLPIILNQRRSQRELLYLPLTLRGP